MRKKRAKEHLQNRIEFYKNTLRRARYMCDRWRFLGVLEGLHEAYVILNDYDGRAVVASNHSLDEVRDKVYSLDAAVTVGTITREHIDSIFEEAMRVGRVALQNADSDDIARAQVCMMSGMGRALEKLGDRRGQQIQRIAEVFGEPCCREEIIAFFGEGGN